MITLRLIAEFPEATSPEQARSMLDAFREAVLPASEYGIVLYEGSADRHEAEQL